MADGVDTGTAAMVNMLANPPNPFERAGQSIAGINALKDFQARQATAGLYGQAIDPATGQFDSGKFNALLQASPQALWNAGPAMQQAGTAQAAQGEGTQQQVAAAAAQLHGIGTQMAPLIQKIEQNQQVSPGEAQAALDSAVSSGLVNPQMAAHVKSQIDAIPAGGNANNIVMGANFANSTGQEIANTIGPQPGAYQVGGKTVFVPQGPFWPGSVARGGEIAHTLSPGEAASVVTINMGDGTTKQMPLAQAQQLFGANYQSRIVPEGGTAPPVPSGRYMAPPAAQTPSGAPAADTSGGAPPDATTQQPQPQGGAAPPGFGVSRPGLAEAAAAAAKGSAEDQLDFRRDLPAAQGRIFTAQQALSALQDAKTGTGTVPLQTINGIINSYAPDALKAWVPGYDPNMAINRDLAEKYMTQLTMGRAAQFGPTTDARLAAAFSGSANTHIQQLAAQDVLKVGIGLDRMNQAMGDDMQNQNVSPQDFSAWRQNWVRNHDPRAFVVDSMTPAQRGYLQKDLQSSSPQQRDIFAQTYHQAVSGYVPNVIANPRAATPGASH
jgi:hypothetical protein